MDRDVSIRIGIMQGRLLPPVNGRIQAFPRDHWPEEFLLARELGFSNIEFIFDMEEENDIEAHPLLELRCRTISSLVEISGVSVTTVCGDYFMRHPFHRGRTADIERSVELLHRLVANGPSLGITDIVIPCVDKAFLASQEEWKKLVERLSGIVSECEAVGVNMALETDLDPIEVQQLLTRFGSKRVTVNYDVGNSASLGYNPVVEWDYYGDRVSSVHIKDRLLGGPTVLLGTGAARFEDFFRVTRKSGYRGLFIIQGARGRDDLITAAQYKEFVERHLIKFYGDE